MILYFLGGLDVHEDFGFEAGAAEFLFGHEVLAHGACAREALAFVLEHFFALEAHRAAALFVLRLVSVAILPILKTANVLKVYQTLAPLHIDFEIEGLFVLFLAYHRLHLAVNSLKFFHSLLGIVDWFFFALLHYQVNLLLI